MSSQFTLRRVLFAALAGWVFDIKKKTEEARTQQLIPTVPNGNFKLGVYGSLTYINLQH